MADTLQELAGSKVVEIKNGMQRLGRDVLIVIVGRPTFRSTCVL
jgi:hypothetical protein